MSNKKINKNTTSLPLLSRSSKMRQIRTTTNASSSFGALTSSVQTTPLPKIFFTLYTYPISPQPILTPTSIDIKAGYSPTTDKLYQVSLLNRSEPFYIYNDSGKKITGVTFNLANDILNNCSIGFNAYNDEIFYIRVLKEYNDDSSGKCVLKCSFVLEDSTTVVLNALLSWSIIKSNSDVCTIKLTPITGYYCNDVMGKSCAIQTDGGATLKVWLNSGGKCPATQWSSRNNMTPITPFFTLLKQNDRIYCDSGCEDQRYGYSYCSSYDIYTLPDNVISRIIYNANLPYIRYDDQGLNPYWVYPLRKTCDEIMGRECDVFDLERWRKLGGDGVGKMSDAELKNYITAVGPTYCNKIVGEDCGTDATNGSAIFNRWVNNGGRCYDGESQSTTFSGGRSCTTGCRTDSYPYYCA
jgi:hypothetical protein